MNIQSYRLFWLAAIVVLSSTNCSARTTQNPRESATYTNSASPQRRTNRRQSQLSKLTGLVVNVKDGDTIALLDDDNVTHDVRLHAVDAPEKKQDFSNVARRHLAELLAGKKVDIEYNERRNSHERLIGKVSVNGLDVGLEQIKAGLAWHAKEFAKEQTEADREAYAAAELEARAAKRGLWQYPSPIPPWEFPSRQKIKKDPQPTKPAPASATITSASGPIIGNKNSGIYHWLGCPNYSDVASWNRVYFKTREDAERAGYRAARNCN